VRSADCIHKPRAETLIALMNCGPTARTTSAGPMAIGRPAYVTRGKATSMFATTCRNRDAGRAVRETGERRALDYERNDAAVSPVIRAADRKVQPAVGAFDDIENAPQSDDGQERRPSCSIIPPRWPVFNPTTPHRPYLTTHHHDGFHYPFIDVYNFIINIDLIGTAGGSRLLILTYL
jgi:hypothetical protein